MIQREVFNWGVKLTVKPLPDTKPTLVLNVEISRPKPSRGVAAGISFSGVTQADALRIVEAQTWIEAFTALVQETRGVIAELKNEEKKKAAKK